jgi:hypothetical protein
MEMTIDTTTLIAFLEDEAFHANKVGYDGEQFFIAAAHKLKLFMLVQREIASIREHLIECSVASMSIGDRLDNIEKTMENG